MISLPLTLQAVEKLLTLLQCDHCGTVLHEPYTTGVCDHLLCSKCRSGENNRQHSTHCPVCSVPVHPRDFQLHPEIAQLVLVARRLKKLASTSTPGEIDLENSEKALFETDLDAAMSPVCPSGRPTEEFVENQQEKPPEPRITHLRAYSPASLAKTFPTPSSHSRPSVVLKRGLSTNAESSATETQSVCTSASVSSNPSLTYKPRIKRCRGASLASETSEVSVTKLPAYRRPTDPSQGFATSTRSMSSLGSIGTGKPYSPATSLSDMASGSMDVVLQAATHALRTRQSKRSALRDLAFSANVTSVPIASPEQSHLADAQSPSLLKVKCEEPASPTTFNQTGDFVNPQTKSVGIAARVSVQPDTTKTKLRDRTSLNVRGAKSDGHKPSGFSKFMKKLRPNGKGESVLHRAAIRGNLEQVQNYLSSGLSPDLRDHAGWTPLHEAVLHGHVKIAEALLKSGATVDIPGGPDLDTPLHDAIQNAQSACCELLLAYGANPILPNGSGLTPLQLIDSYLSKLLACSPTTKRSAVANNQRHITTSNSLKTIRSALLKAISQRQSTDIPKVEPAISKTVLPGGLTFIERRRLRPVLLSTGLSRPQQATFTRVAAMIHAQVVNTISPEVTHVITGATQEPPVTNRPAKKSSNPERASSGDRAMLGSIQQTSCPRTLKFLNAVLLGCWILSFDWIETCAHVKMRVEEEGFEVTGCSATPLSGAPRRARLAREAGSLGLFHRFRFCFLGEFVYPVPSSNDLTMLARSGGATVVFCRERCSPLRLARLAIEMNDASLPPDWELVESSKCTAEDDQDFDGDDEDVSIINQAEVLSVSSASPLLVIYSAAHNLNKLKPATSIPYAVKVVSQALSMLKPRSNRANLSDPPLKAVPSTWLLDCAAEYCILPEPLH